jgi:hypothetical protein
MDFIVKALIALGGALLANAVVKETTGKSIPQHVSVWWAGTRDAIAAWAQVKGHSNILSIVCFVDNIATSTQKMFSVQGTTRHGHTEVIETKRLGLAEIQKQFPGMNIGERRDITSLAI